MNSTTSNSSLTSRSASWLDSPASADSVSLNGSQLRPRDGYRFAAFALAAAAAPPNMAAAASKALRVRVCDARKLGVVDLVGLVGADLLDTGC